MEIFVRFDKTTRYAMESLKEQKNKIVNDRGLLIIIFKKNFLSESSQYDL